MDSAGGLFDPEKARQRVFVTNFYPTVTDEDLRNLFTAHGKITGLFLHPKRYYAFVEFAEESAVRDALRKDGQLLKGWPLDVRRSRKELELRHLVASGQAKDDSLKHGLASSMDSAGGLFDPERARQRIFVTHFCPTVTDEDLRNLFLAHGEITGLFLHPKRHYAFVEFADESAVRDALRKDGALLKGWPLDVRRSRKELEPRHLFADGQAKDDSIKHGLSRRRCYGGPSSTSPSFEHVNKRTRTELAAAIVILVPGKEAATNADYVYEYLRTLGYMVTIHFVKSSDVKAMDAAIESVLLDGSRVACIPGPIGQANQARELIHVTLVILKEGVISFYPIQLSMAADFISTYFERRMLAELRCEIEKLAAKVAALPRVSVRFYDTLIARLSHQRDLLMLQGSNWQADHLSSSASSAYASGTSNTDDDDIGLGYDYASTTYSGTLGHDTGKDSHLPSSSSTKYAALRPTPEGANKAPVNRTPYGSYTGAVSARSRFIRLDNRWHPTGIRTSRSLASYSAVPSDRELGFLCDPRIRPDKGIQDDQRNQPMTNSSTNASMNWIHTPADLGGRNKQLSD